MSQKSIGTETTSTTRHCELCRAWGHKTCPFETVEECDKENGRATQKNCIYGYILPDRCRYWNNQGCPCGEYPPCPPVILDKPID